MAGSNVFRLLLQFAILPILARLLDPSAYGLVALAMPCILLASLFTDGGLGNAIVRAKTTSAALESTVFWTATAISLGLAIVICGLAWPIAWIVRQPALAPILIALSLILVLSGTSAAANARILRLGRLSAYALGDVVSGVLGAGSAIWAALHGAGAWSLVIQQLVQWSVRLVIAWRASGFRLTWEFKPSLLNESWAFGANSVGLGLLDFASRNVDSLLIGAILGVSALGQYTMAYQVMRIPELVVSGPVYVSLYPLLTRLDDAAIFARTALSSIRLVGGVILPIFTGLALVSDLALTLILGAKWAPAAQALILLAPAGAAFGIYALFAAVLFARGRANRQLRIAIPTATVTALAVVLGSFIGINGVAIGVSLSMLLFAPLYLRFVGDELGASMSEMAGVLGPPLIGCAVMAAAVLPLRHALASTEPLLLLLASIAVGVVAYVGTVYAIAGRTLTADVRLVLSARPAAAAP